MEEIAREVRQTHKNWDDKQGLSACVCVCVCVLSVCVLFIVAMERRIADLQFQLETSTARVPELQKKLERGKKVKVLGKHTDCEHCCSLFLFSTNKSSERGMVLLGY